MSTFDNLVDDCLRTLQGYGLSQPRAAFLTAACTSSALALTVGDATSFEQGIAEVGNETVFIQSVDTTNGILTISPDGRGYYGSTAASHSIGDRVTMAPVWSRHVVANAINDAILNCYPTLFGVASTTFTFNPAINTYALPATAERVLQVTCDTIGPSKEQLEIKRYSVNSNAPTTTFPTGNTITLEKGPFPGRSVKVVYKTGLSAIDFGDPFTDSGLAETAKRAIKYAVCSDLIAYMDSARLPVDTAQADELDGSRNPVGSATKISAQLYQRYLIELENERKRLRESTPTIVSVRTR